jgi:hypothetical protein
MHDDAHLLHAAANAPAAAPGAGNALHGYDMLTTSQWMNICCAA